MASLKRDLKTVLEAILIKQSLSKFSLYIYTMNCVVTENTLVGSILIQRLTDSVIINCSHQSTQ